MLFSIFFTLASRQTGISPEYVKKHNIPGCNALNPREDTLQFLRDFCPQKYKK